MTRREKTSEANGVARRNGEGLSSEADGVARRTTDDSTIEANGVTRLGVTRRGRGQDSSSSNDNGVAKRAEDGSSFDDNGVAKRSGADSDSNAVKTLGVTRREDQDQDGSSSNTNGVARRAGEGSSSDANGVARRGGADSDLNTVEALGVTRRKASETNGVARRDEEGPTTEALGVTRGEADPDSNAVEALGVTRRATSGLSSEANGVARVKRSTDSALVPCTEAGVATDAVMVVRETNIALDEFGWCHMVGEPCWKIRRWFSRRSAEASPAALPEPKAESQPGT